MVAAVSIGFTLPDSHKPAGTPVTEASEKEVIKMPIARARRSYSKVSATIADVGEVDRREDEEEESFF